jgi:hypothetical protein
MCEVDPFEIRVDIEPETTNLATLYSFWNGRTTIAHKLPLKQAMEHLAEYLKDLAEDLK